MTIYCSPATKARILNADSFAQRARGNNDDEVSITSTFTVDLTGKQSPCPAEPQPQRRRVTFDESYNVVHRTTQDEDCHLTDRWETSDAMKQMKTRTVLLAREINRSDKASSAQQNNVSYPRVVLGVYLTCSAAPRETDQSPLSATQRKQFYKWMDLAESRIGLERACIHEIRMDKYRRRTQVAHAVLEAQYRCGLTEQRGDRDDESIRNAARSVSLASRLFARELALAQAASLQK